MDVPPEAIELVGRLDHPHSGLMIGTDAAAVLLTAAQPLIARRIAEQLRAECDGRPIEGWESAAAFIEREFS